MVPRRHHTKPNKPKMATPSAPPIDTEPISLELFNHAAADLDAKGGNPAEKVSKVLKQERIIMEAAREFVMSGELKEFAYNHMLKGHPTPPALFIDIVVEKCQLINQHFCNTRDHLRVVTSVTNTVATIKFLHISLANSPLKIVTLTNTSDLKNQLIQLWVEVQKLLRFFHEEDRIAEMASIESYYRNFAYKRQLTQLFTFEFY